MIGDDIVSDVGGAQQCGMRALQVRTGKYRSVLTLHIQLRATRLGFSLPFSLPFPLVSSRFAFVVCPSTSLCSRDLAGWWYFLLGKCRVKVAERGGHSVFDLLKKYFLLNACYISFITAHRTGVFPGVCLFLSCCCMKVLYT